MLQEELKKILVKQRVLLILVIMFIVQAGYISFRGLYSHTVTKVAEKNEEIYEKFSSSLNGKWNQRKDVKLDEWLQKRDQGLVKYNTLVDQLLAGEISEETLYTYYKATPFCQTQYMEVLDELNEQRTYIKQNPKQRYMMKTNGWVYFFEDYLLYYLYFLLLVVLFIPLFIREKETQMNLLQSLSTKGQGRIFNHKILAAVIIMWGGLFLLAGEKYMLYLCRCGMKDITYPIQSLPIFKDCPWNVPIGVGILVELLFLACAGYLFGGFIILCSILIPKMIEVCLLVLIVVFVPMFVVSEEMLFRYPILTSLLFPKQFVYGWRDINVGKMVYKTQKELILIGVVVMLAGTVLLLLARKRGQKL